MGFNAPQFKFANRNGNSPCFECEKRTGNCHASCEDYISWKSKYEEKKRVEDEKKEINARIISYDVAWSMKRKKRGGKGRS